MSRPLRMWLKRALLMLLLAAAGLGLWLYQAGTPQLVRVNNELALVLPDGLSENNVHVLAWLSAAAELGYGVKLLYASAMMRQSDADRDMALIVPDSVHRRMNDQLVAELDNRVRAGAVLMLVHDAGLSDMGGKYHPQQSRFSGLAGVRYALYGDMQTDMLRQQVPLVDAAALPLLRLPPGKLRREDSDDPLTSAQPAPKPGEALAVVSYHYGRLHYPVFATAAAAVAGQTSAQGYAGQRLMHGDDQTLLAGVLAVGQGRVLFVNLPLGYLKLRTDGFFLSSFLRYFAQDLAQLPQLSPMPMARGALIMNWHVDSGRAVPAMKALEALGAFEQGPYSVHMTVGPDVNAVGDKLGMDLANNPLMQDWVHRFVARGDEVGSHGGWAHNEFGRLIGSQAREQSIAMIERNNEVLSKASGRPVREYSAPTGNHPAWVTEWLRERGVRAYYFTGDIGMAPTRSFQDGERGAADMWAFPVLSYGKFASFEEASANHVPEAFMSAWLQDVSDYCADFRTARLVYFHPPGIAIFPKAFRQWLQHTADLIAKDRLRWMTMNDFASFANRRMKADWSLQADPQRPGQQLLLAQHAQSLDQLTWLLPALRYGRPEVTQGQAQVQRDGPYWRVIAGDQPKLALKLELLAAPVAKSNITNEKSL